MNERKIKEYIAMLLDFEYDRLSSSGREILEEIADELGLFEVQEEIAQ